jgi:cyclic-di-GMP phosphodiesterase TipF (flagellum assembly factor)
MGRLGWFPAAALAGATATALFVCLWAFYLRGRDEAAIAAVILFLSLAQLVYFIYQDLRRNRDIAELFVAISEDGDLAKRLAELEERFASLADEEPSQDIAPAVQPAANKPALLDEVKELRASLQSIAAQATARPQLREPTLSSPPAPQLTEDRLDLYLEPIVSLATQSTRHYRVSLGLEAGNGHRSEHDALYSDAERSGLRAALDVFALQRVVPVARRLLSKRPEARLFIPIGAATLSRPSYVAEIERQIKASRHVAQGLVFEIAQAVLAKLDAAGIEGLARLARQGPLLCLGNVETAGIDFSALRGLRFRYLSFAASQLSQDRSRLAALAVSQGFEILAADVRSPEQLGEVTRWAALGRGPAFAPPRLVKPDSAADMPAQAA